MDEMDRTIQLSNAIAELLNGEEIDDVIPSLVMVLHHAAKSSGIPMDAVNKFVSKCLAFECPDEEEITKH
jgi:hypothetical protein